MEKEKWNRIASHRIYKWKILCEDLQLYARSLFSTTAQAVPLSVPGSLVFQRLVDVCGIENHISQEPSCFLSIAFAQYKAEKKHFLPLKTKQTAMNVMKIDTNCWSVYGLNGKR